jgi:hypothetical protein
MRHDEAAEIAQACTETHSIGRGYGGMWYGASFDMLHILGCTWRVPGV